MPFYEYQCSSCSHHVEVLQKITDAPLRKCPDCGKQTLKKLMSAPVFRLKGSGWYETDFKSENEQKRNLADRDEGGDSKSEESKTDSGSKSEAKSESKSSSSKVSSTTTKKAAKPAAKPSKPAAKAAAKRAKPAKASKPAARKKSRR
jgi:putative FmdB family regulatory protein